MPEKPRPEGQLYDLVYGQPREAVADTATFRRRAYRICGAHAGLSYELVAFIERTTGIAMPKDLPSNSLERLFTNSSIGDVRHALTAVFRYVEKQSPRSSEAFVRETNVALSETGTAYTMDPRGGIHPSIDPAFTKDRGEIIRGINAERYSAARSHFERAMQNLDAVSLDRTQAVRGVFDAVEAVFKLMTSADRLTGDKIQQRISLDDLYSGRSLRSANDNLNALREWVAACHHYRHAEAGEKPDPVPEGLAISLISSGISHLRWLISLDKKLP
jgi:hypothetical protein